MVVYATSVCNNDAIFFLLLNIWSSFYDVVLCASHLADEENHAGCLDNCFLAFMCVCVGVRVPVAFLLGAIDGLGLGISWLYSL